MTTSVAQSAQKTEALLESTYELLFTHEVELDVDGLLAWGEIFDQTLGNFLEHNARTDIWAAPAFKNRILAVVGRIAAYAKRTASQSPRVTRAELVRAAAEVMKDADEHSECERIVEEWNKNPTRGVKAMGFICSMFLRQLADSAERGAPAA